MIDDNPFVYRLLPFDAQLDNLLTLEGMGADKGFFDMAFLPNVGTQKILNYLHNGKNKHQFNLQQ